MTRNSQITAYSVLGPILAVAALTLSFWAGGAAKPAVEKERLVEVVKWQDRVEYRDRIVTVIERAEATKTVRKPVQLASGKVAYETTKETQATASAKQDDAKEAVQVQWRVEEKWLDREVVREVRPSWSVEMLGGHGWLGGAASRLVVGPLSAGMVVIHRLGNGTEFGGLLRLEF